MVDRLEYPPQVRLFRCRSREVGVFLPIPLSGRLDALVEIGKDAWAPVMRKEVMSALLLAARADVGWLRQALSRYGRARVSDAFVPGWEKWFFLWPPEDRGPRPLRLWGDVEEWPDDVPPVREDDALTASAVYRIGMPVPGPLAGRLDLLVRLAAANGAATSRKELLAALILDAPTQGAKLAATLKKYWHATVADAVIAGQPTDQIFAWTEPRAQRTRRRRATLPATHAEPEDRPTGRVRRGRRVPSPNAPTNRSSGTAAQDKSIVERDDTLIDESG